MSKPIKVIYEGYIGEPLAISKTHTTHTYEMIKKEKKNFKCLVNDR